MNLGRHMPRARPATLVSKTSKRGMNYLIWERLGEADRAENLVRCAQGETGFAMDCTVVSSLSIF